ncbi:unnamed protein product [Lymnaea stagnalis]|uniref:Fucosyltransferase n=1 Tax=Lymnaea stagnalis TaxID=6523 RepID=A0AAV2HTC2_LYMST
MFCRSRRNALLVLCALSVAFFVLEEFLQEFHVIIIKHTHNFQENDPEMSAGSSVLTSEIFNVEGVPRKPQGRVGGGKDLFADVERFINRAAELGGSLRSENVTRKDWSGVNGKLTDANTDSGGHKDNRNISEVSETRDRRLEEKEEADAVIESVKANVTVADASYDDPYDDDIDRLMSSPFIFNERYEKKRLSATLVQRSVKKVSGYMPYESNWVRKSFRGCRYDKCQFIGNMSQADAVLFGGGRIRDHVIPYFYRPPGQRWIFYTFDPAANNYALDRPDAISSFNWTMSHQLDSDYPFLFGRLLRRDLPVKDYDQIYDSKVNHTAWFVSHCDTWSKREIYVNRMKKVIPVDVFGGCSDRRCGAVHYRTHDSTLCLPMLSKSYKFYLAFENSFCKDYLTEKFFKLFGDVDVVPVVRGGFNYKKYLPSGIFVDAGDFKTPEVLADYLLQLGNDKVEYVKMLKRKNRWVSTYTDSFQCNICEALHTAENKTGFIPNLKTKFNGDPPYCWAPRDLGPP